MRFYLLLTSPLDFIIIDNKYRNGPIGVSPIKTLDRVICLIHMRTLHIDQVSSLGKVGIARAMYILPTIDGGAIEL